MRRSLLCCLIALLFTVFSLVLFSSFVNIPHRIILTDESDQKVILLWTNFFGEKDYVKFPTEFKCKESRCIFTSNRSILDRSHAVIFHSADINEADLPKSRTPEQIWIWHALESPINSRMSSSLNGMMNWTATYRRDSDIWTPYGSFRKSGKIILSNRNYAANKTKMAVWFVSNCHTESNREGYVQEMMKEIPVDIYGVCGDKECLPKMSRDCYHMVGDSYRFYLAFENSYCRDYVTEKLFHALETSMIPVVFGDGHYSSIAPEGSFIDASGFRSPRELAQYLQEVAANDTLYNSYFDWKRYYSKGGYHWSCELCNKLHQSYILHSVYNSLDKWWEEPGICKRWENGVLAPVNMF